MMRLAALTHLVLAVSILSACDKPPRKFESTDITGSPLRADFRMNDQHGMARTMDDFKGKIVAMFFGFTHCPDVCPSTLSELKSALSELPPAAAKDVQVVLVTVDPERDTSEVLTQYLGAFDPAFIGLRGTPDELQSLARQMRVIYQRSEGRDGSYTMDHNSATFLFDRQGRIRLLVPHGAVAKVIAHDIAILLDEK